jgi:RimJ/RimL family protein N-acetyltransferase
MLASTTPLDAGPLRGERVHLLPLHTEHAEPLLRAASESRETYALTSVPETLDGMRRFVEVSMEAARVGLAVPFATVDAAAGRVVGTTRFATLESWITPVAGARDLQPASVEIGWTWLAASAQRTHVNTEAKLLMLRHAFEQWGVRRVMLKTHERNARSRAAIERLGCTLDGLLRTLLPGGGTRISAVYSLLAEEWPAAQERLRARLSAQRP